MRWLLALPLLDDVRGWEKLLHQAFLVGLEGFVLLRLGGDQGVEARKALGDALLFVFITRNAQRAFGHASFAEVSLVEPIVER